MDCLGTSGRDHEVYSKKYKGVVDNFFKKVELRKELEGEDLRISLEQNYPELKTEIEDIEKSLNLRQLSVADQSDEFRV